MADIISVQNNQTCYREQKDLLIDMLDKKKSVTNDLFETNQKLSYGTYVPGVRLW